MPTIRELLISFGTEVDKSSLDKTDKQIQKGAEQTAQKVQTIISGAFTFGIVKGAFALTGLASSVEETLNILDVAFQENRESVIAWSKDFGNAAKRNQFELQRTAGVLGALLNPMLDNNAKLAAEMSTKLAELSVDLASLFEATDNETLVALRSAIVGELEPMRRFGVNMTVAALEAFALEQGIRGAYKTMTEAERTQLRFNFLMDKTTIAQGDAIKTADSWANSAKGLRAKLKEVATMVGLKLLPFMTKLAIGARNILAAFTSWVDGTHLIEAALVTLGAVAVGVATKLLIAFAPVLIPLLKFAAIIAIVALAVDDFLTFLEGGDSIIGRFIDSIWGPGSAAEAAKKLREAWAAFKEEWTNNIVPALKTGLVSAQRDVENFIALMLDDVVPALGRFGEETEKAIAMMGESLSAFFADVGRWFSESLEAVKEFMTTIQEALGVASRFLGLPTIDKFLFGDEEKESRVQPSLAGAELGPVVGPLPGTVGPFSDQPRILAPRSAAAAGGPVTQNVTQTTNVTVQGDATPRTASTIVEGAVRGTADTNRKTLAALVQRKQS
jgi:hypothetical protein